MDMSTQMRSSSLLDWMSMCPVTLQSDLRDGQQQRMSPEAEATAWLRDEPMDTATGGDPVTLQNDFRDGQQQRISPEAKATAWLRDVPMDTVTGGDHHTSASAAFVGQHCGGSGKSEGKKEIERSGGLSDRSRLWGTSPDRSEDFAAQRQGSSMPASVFAQLRATKIKESVIREAIQRHGGGRKGLEGVIKAIMLWLKARARYLSQASDPGISQSESLSPVVAGVDHLPWSNAEPGVVADVQSGSVGEHAFPTDLNFMMNSISSCLDDGASLCALAIGCSGSGEYGEVPNVENQSHVVIDESGRDGVLGGLRSQSGLHITLDESLSQQDRIRRHHSPSSPGVPEAHQSSCELPVDGNPATSEIFGPPGIFGPSGATPFATWGPLIPLSPPSVEIPFKDFTSLGIHGSLLIDENLETGSSDGCGLIDRSGSLGYPVSHHDNSSDPKKSGPRLGVLTKSKVTPAARSRMARKNRMSRNRMVNLGAFENDALVEPGKTSSSWSLRTLSRSQGSLGSEGQSSMNYYRKDKGHLQFLLEKILRLSDVGNLGRIVLPKREAESQLPWLCVKEGIQFDAEDYDTSETMHLRYRFWPNNKSRMYLFENTGAFVKRYKLQESDRMLIYKNRQRGTYVIRACKAQDWVDGLPSKAYDREMEGERKEFSEQSAPWDTWRSRKSSYAGDVQVPVSNVSSGLGGTPECVASIQCRAASPLPTFAAIAAHNGKGLENLVQFPSVESFDVKLLEGAAATNAQDARSCVLEYCDED